LSEATLERPVGRKKREGNVPATTTKVDPELIKKAKAVATHRGILLYDLVDQILRPAVEEAYGQYVKDFIREHKKGR
jgi:hypothetical protein